MGIATRWRLGMAAALAAAACSVAGAQLLPPVPVPDVGGTAGTIGRTADRALGEATDNLEAIRGDAGALAQARVGRLEALVRAHRDRLEMTDAGPAVRGQVIALDPDPAALAAALQAGFTRQDEERIEGLDIRSVTLGVPRGWSVDRALSRLRRIAPSGTFAANHLHGQSGAAIAIGAAALAQGGRRDPQPWASSTAASPPIRRCAARSGSAASPPARRAPADMPPRSPP